MIAHPPGEEIEFDWLVLPDAPDAWGVGEHAHLLVGALAHSGRWRAVLAESEDFPPWSSRLTKWCASWAGLRGGGGSTGWRRSVIRAAGRSPLASRRWRSITH